MTPSSLPVEIHRAAGKASAHGCVGATLMLYAQALRSLAPPGVELETIGAFEGDALTAPHAWVSTEDAVRFFDEVSAPLSEADASAVAALWLRRHPALRAVATLAPTLDVLLDVFMVAFSALHPMASVQLRRSGEVVEVLARGALRSAGLRRFVRHVVTHAPLLIGAASLRALPSPDEPSLLGRWDRRTSGSVALRVARSTGIRLSAVFRALEKLPADVVAGQCDGPSTTAGSAASDVVTTFARAHGLTPTETRVLGLLDAGLRPAELAAELSMRTPTARVHLKRIFAKTGANGQRSLLAQLATRRLT